MLGRSSPGTLLWLAILFFLAVLITITVFLTVVPAEQRGVGFYIWMSVVCGAEFVCFAWTANYGVTRERGRGASGATLQTIHVMIAVWFLFTIVLAIGWGAPGDERGRYNDGVALIYAVLTFLFLFGASMMYLRDVEVQAEDRALRPQRLELQIHVADVEKGCEDVRQWATQYSEYTVPADRLAKRLESLVTSLRFVPPGKVGTLEEGAERHVGEFNSKIAARLEELKARLADTGPGPGGPVAYLETLDKTVDQIESLLRQRQQFLIVGG